MIMKYTLTFEDAKNRFTLKTFGNLTMFGIQDMIKQLVSHQDWKKGRDLFIDHREASFEEISVEDIMLLSKMVTMLDETLGARRCSVISSDDGHMKNAMYKNTVDPDKADIVTRTFSALQYNEAIAWLDNQL